MDILAGAHADPRKLLCFFDIISSYRQCRAGQDASSPGRQGDDWRVTGTAQFNILYVLRRPGVKAAVLLVKRRDAAVLPAGQLGCNLRRLGLGKRFADVRSDGIIGVRGDSNGQQDGAYSQDDYHFNQCETFYVQ